MMITSAVIFDLDGTLLDTIEDITDCANLALVAHGLAPYTIEEYKLFVGNGVDELVKGLLGTKAKDTTLFDSVKAMYRQEYAIRQRDKTRPYLGIKTLLRKLNQKHIQIGVLSNKPDSDTQSVIQSFFPNIKFAFVYGKKPEFPIKPNPASVNDMIAKMQVTKDQVLYVGDTGTDMMTAKNAGLEAIGVLWGFRHQEELLRHGADHLITTPRELLTIIETRESYDR